MKGLLWVFFEKVGVTVLSLIAMFWYAKLLGPVDFGLSIVILSASLFVSTIIENVQQYPLIATKENVGSAFKSSAIGWLILSSLIATGLFVLLTFVYGNDWWLLILFAVVYIPVSSFSRIYIADLILKQKFKQLAIRAFWGKIIGVLTGLITAYFGYVEFAIILQSLTVIVVSLIVMVITNKTLIKQSESFSLVLFKSLVIEGVPSGVAIIEQNVKSHGLIVLLGIFAGAHISGIYSLAVKFVDIPRTLIGLGFSTWAMGKFNQVMGNKSKLLDVFNTAMLCCCSVILPCYVGMMAVSEALILEFFAREWFGAAKIIFFLSLYQAIVSFYIYLPPLQVLYKATYRTLWVNVVSTSCIILSIIFLSDNFGIYAPLIGMFSSLLFTIPKYTFEIVELLETRVLAIMHIIYGVVISVALMYVLIDFAEKSLIVNNFYVLVIFGVVSYSLIFTVFNLANIINRKILANIKSL
ncbi:oligosaccharide flippase family protein [Pseudoalteromonas shioyasakiensis]|uniref:oligosaccharide flippase family protein n=1 Tax=Pseudoalteromonas shioyasakiensis TaxID=1190813 RepID=UPI0021199F14|nr:oligosaccharide flippase family protein [Pseudoalteromonas shioyasakiensis]MCQ8876510.1 oligosaccharide flippase family protein [Pseudoalteromonas shioyasakiensis]